MKMSLSNNFLRIQCDIRGDIADRNIGCRETRLRDRIRQIHRNPIIFMNLVILIR